MDISGFDKIIGAVNDWFGVIALILLILGSLAGWVIKNASTAKMRMVVLFAFMMILTPVIYIKLVQPNGKECVKVAGLDHLKDTERYLAVRHDPYISETNEFRRLYLDNLVEYLGKSGNWYQIAGLKTKWNGWSHNKYLVPSSCEA